MHSNSVNSKKLLPTSNKLMLADYRYQCMHTIFPLKCREPQVCHSAVNRLLYLLVSWAAADMH